MKGSSVSKAEEQKAQVKNLRIYYDGPLDEKLDKVLEKALKPFGFERWASGYNVCEDIRDLAFDNRNQRTPQ